MVFFLVNVEERKEFDRMEKNKEELEQEKEELEVKIAEIQRQLDEHDAKRAEQGETVGTVPSPPKPVVAKEQQTVSSPKPTVVEEKQADSGEKVHKPLPKARNDGDNSYTQEIIDSIQLKKAPYFYFSDVGPHKGNNLPRNCLHVREYVVRMMDIGMSEEKVLAMAKPYMSLIPSLVKKIEIKQKEHKSIRVHGCMPFLTALGLGMLIEHERDYPGLYNLDMLETAIACAVVRYGDGHGNLCKNWPRNDDIEIPDYVFSWVENPAYLETELYLHFRGEV